MYKYIFTFFLLFLTGCDQPINEKESGVQDNIIDTIISESGDITEIYIDGSQKTIHPNGSTTHISKEGVRTEKKIEGTVKITQVDGSYISTDIYGVIEEVNTEGVSKVINPEGDFTITSANKEEIVYHDKDKNIIKTKIIENENSYSIILPNSSTIEVFDNSDLKIGEKTYEVGNTGNYVIENIDNITSSYYDHNKILQRKKVMFLDDSDFYSLLTLNPYSLIIYNNNDVKIGFKTLDPKSVEHYFVTLDSNNTTVLYDSSNDLLIGSKINSPFNDGSYILNYLELSESKFYNHTSDYLGVYKIDTDNLGFFFIEYSDKDISYFDSNGNLITNKTINSDNSYQIENASGTVVEYYNDIDTLTHTKNINNDNSYIITNADASIIESFDNNGVLVSTKNINNDGSYTITNADASIIESFDNNGVLVSTKNINNDGSYTITNTDNSIIQSFDINGVLINTKNINNDGSYNIALSDDITTFYYDSSDVLLYTIIENNNDVYKKIEVDNTYTIVSNNGNTVEYYNESDDRIKTISTDITDNSYTITSADGHIVTKYDSSDTLIQTKNIDNEGNYSVLVETTPNLISYYNFNDILLNTIDNDGVVEIEKSYNEDGSIHFTKITDLTNGNYTIENTDANQIDYYNGDGFKYKTTFTHSSGLILTTDFFSDGRKIETTETIDNNKTIVEYDSDGTIISETLDGFIIITNGNLKKYYYENSPADSSDDVLFKTEYDNGDGTKVITFYRPDETITVVVDTQLDSGYLQTNYELDGITVLSTKNVNHDGTYFITEGDIVTHYDDFDNITKIISNNGDGTNTQTDFDEHGIKLNHIINANDGSYQEYYDIDTGTILEYIKKYDSSKLKEIEYYTIDPRIEYYDINEQLSYTKITADDGSYYNESANGLIFDYYNSDDFLMVNIIYDEHGAFVKTIYNLDSSYSKTINDIDFDNYDQNNIYINTTTTETDHEEEHQVNRPHTIEIFSYTEIDGSSAYYGEMIGDYYIDQGVGQFININTSTNEFMITEDSVDQYHWYIREELNSYIQILAFDGTQYSIFNIAKYKYKGINVLTDYYSYASVTSSYIEHESERYIDYEQSNIQYNSFIPVRYEFNDTKTIKITENTDTIFETLGFDSNDISMNLSNHINFNSDNHNINYNNGVITAYNNLGTTLSDVYYEDTYIDTITTNVIEYKSYCLADGAVGTGYSRLEPSNREEFLTCGYLYRGHAEIINPNSTSFQLKKQYKYPSTDIDYYDYYIKNNNDGTYLILAYYYGTPGYTIYKLLGDPSTFEVVNAAHKANPRVLNRESVDYGSYVNYNLTINSYFYEEND